MRKVVVLLTISYLLLVASCQMVPIMSSPTRSEKKIPAGYDLPAQKDKKIAVLIEAAAWSQVPQDMSKKLADAIRLKLTSDLGIKAKQLIDQKKVDRALSEKTTAFTKPVEIGKIVGADLVLYVQLEESTIVRIPETEYFKGLFSGRAAMFNCALDALVWPGAAGGKAVAVGYEVEQRSYDAAEMRLIRAFAHCTTRYLYNCPVPRFKVNDDKAGTGWQHWQN